MKDKIEYIVFDADDTLWDSEVHIQDFESRFCKLLEAHLPAAAASQELFKTEMKNLHIYGYGLKSIMLSMIETICRITGGGAQTACIDEIIGAGQELLQKPVTLLDGVQQVLAQLHGRYKLVLATKGDLLDQERKINDSGLKNYFHHIEIMNDKRKEDYAKLLQALACPASSVMMVGNSIKSDILPVLELGGYAAHIPYHVTWQYEHHEGEITHPHFIGLKNIREIMGFLPQ